jgi:hypothetical protein
VIGSRWTRRLAGEVCYAAAQARNTGAHAGVMLGYWIRPYDMHLDARRWRWEQSGRQRSHDAIAASPALLAAISQHADDQLRGDVHRIRAWVAGIAEKARVQDNVMVEGTANAIGRELDAALAARPLAYARTPDRSDMEIGGEG